MPLEVRSCRNAAEANRVRRLLDREFVVSRQRLPRLARRFPQAIGPGKHANIIFAAQDARVAGGLVLRLFEWSTGGRLELGAMIGAVWTAPEWRGQGVARQVLAYARQRALAKGASFAVLWTAQPQVYRASGWRGCDLALRGEWLTGTAASRLRPGQPVDLALARRLHRLRSTQRRDGVVRAARDFTAIPMPAKRVEAFMHEEAYALAGRREGEGFVYEMAGPPAACERLVARLRGAFQHVTINCAPGSVAQEAFRRCSRITWHPQELAMWLPLAGRRLPFADWYVDYLDRI